MKRSLNATSQLMRLTVAAGLLALLSGLGGAGCKKEAPKSQSAATPTPPAAPPADTASADPKAQAGTENGADATGAAEKAADAATADKAPPGGEAAPTVAPPPTDGTEEQRKEIEAYLRSFFEALAKGDMAAAKGMMMSREECLQNWTDPNHCEAMGKGIDEAMADLEKDPVPAGTELVLVHVGERHWVGADRGMKVETGLWVGHVLQGKTPTDHNFQLRSLGVLETQKGLRMLWGKRRSGPDDPRTPPTPPPAPTTPPSDGQAAPAGVDGGSAPAPTQAAPTDPAAAPPAEAPAAPPAPQGEPSPGTAAPPPTPAPPTAPAPAPTP